MVNHSQIADGTIAIVRDIEGDIPKEAKVLDFGCGAGELVLEFLSRGFDTYGVDITNACEHPQLLAESRFKTMEQPPNYRIPFDDDYFDLVFSVAVFEHVFNPEEAFREIHRVLKPGGIAIHSFPSRWYLPVEPHIFVPFASIIQNKAWLSFWALMGIRNQFQTGLSWRETAEWNYRYCQTGIHYVPGNKIKEMVIKTYGNIYYPKQEYIKYAPGGSAKLARRIPSAFLKDIVGTLIFTWRDRVIYMKKLSSSLNNEQKVKMLERQ